MPPLAYSTVAGGSQYSVHKAENLYRQARCE
uniref:Uncharacterized protein n=1 Tax=Anguilla anguilla TaxID=7936 RepID=A0A0E9QHG4_ANGAN